MELANDFVSVIVNEIKDITKYDSAIVYDAEGYSFCEYKRTLLIEIDNKIITKKIILYCDFCGLFEECTLLNDKYLVIAVFNTLYIIDFLTCKIEHKTFSDMAGANRLYLLNDGYLIYGECEIIKLDFSFETEWNFSGADIFASPDGRSAFNLYSDRIELLDWSGNRYVIPLDENLKKQVEMKEDIHCSYKKINENPIILDFANCGNSFSIHRLLKEKFGLPNYYGKNWDALHDCPSMLFEEEITVEIHNFYSLNEGLQEYCQPMFSVFADLHEESPNVVFKVVS